MLNMVLVLEFDLIQILVLPPMRYVDLGKLFNCFKPQFPYL